jgi:hypothetical protein
MYEYTRDHIKCVGFGNHEDSYKAAHGKDGWMVESAIYALENGTGNCYHFAATFAALARGVGFQAYAASDLIGSEDQEHGWVEIVDDSGEVWYSDPETEYARSYWMKQEFDLFYKAKDEIGSVTGIGYQELTDPFKAERKEAEEQGRALTPDAEPIPEEAQARFDAALNGNRKESKRMIAVASSEQPQPVKRAHRWLAYGLTAVSAAAVILVVVLLIGTGGLRGTKPQEPVMPAEQQPMQAETTMEPLPEPGEQEPEPVEIRAEDLEGVWREWTPDNVDVGYRLTLFRDGTAKMVYQIPLSGEQTIEGTYSVKNGITVTFGDETMQAVYDPESDALLLFESETSWLTLYRNPDTYMLEHWFEMQRKPLLKKTVAMEDLFGVWTLERAESAFSSFDLSGLSGYLSIEQGSFRIGMRLAGEDHSTSLACSVIDSVLTETGNSNGKIIAILDPYTNELKLCTLFYERELTEADPVLVFRKLSNAEQTMTQDALVGCQGDGSLDNS